MTDKTDTNTAGHVILTPEIQIDGKFYAIIVKVADEWNQALCEMED